MITFKYSQTKKITYPGIHIHRKKVYVEEVFICNDSCFSGCRVVRTV